MRAVSEMFGAEHTPRAADDWLDEFERIDTLPQTRSDFGSVTIAAAATPGNRAHKRQAIRFTARAVS